MKAVFEIAWDNRWDCYVATHRQYVGIVGTSDQAWAALNNLIQRVNDYDGREVYPMPGGWRCSHQNCACTDRDGIKLSGEAL